MVCDDRRSACDDDIKTCMRILACIQLVMTAAARPREPDTSMKVFDEAADGED